MKTHYRRLVAAQLDKLVGVLWSAVEFGGANLHQGVGGSLRPLDMLIEDLDFFTAEHGPHRVANAIIGAVPSHPILREKASL